MRGYCGEGSTRGGLRRNTRKIARIVQVNINHARQAQDLHVQHMAEWGMDLAIIAEPHSVPGNAGWVADRSGRAAIHVAATSAAGNMVLTERSQGFVVARCKDVDIMSCYISPNITMAEYEKTLSDMSAAIRQCRGESPSEGGLQREIPSLGLLRRGHERRTGGRLGRGPRPANRERGRGTDMRQTQWRLDCVPSVGRRGRDWHVLGGIESLSDHQYITMVLDGPGGSGSAVREGGIVRREWSLR